MEFELKGLSKTAIPAALERAEKYRLLNEPVQAESICRDILATEPDNQHASPAGSSVRNACSPRCSRMRTVPGGTASTSAISAGCSPCCSCSSSA